MKTEETLSTRKYDNWVSSVSWSPNGQLLATAYLEPVVEIWDPETEQQMLTLRGHDSTIWCVAWRPDGRRLATSSWDKTIKIWHATGGAAILTLRGHKHVVTCIDWSPDGQKLASGSRDNDAIIWSATTGEMISTCRGHENFVECVKWSPDGKFLASASFDETIRVWDLDTSEELFTFRGPTGGMVSVAWSSDGNRLAGGSQDGKLMVWDINNGQRVFTVQAHTNSARSVTWNPNGRRLVSGGGDGTIKIRDGGTGEEVLTIRGHKDAVFSVAWSPDGQRLASGSFDYTVKIWDASIGYALDKAQEWSLDPVYVPKGKLTYIDLQSKVNQEFAEDSGGSPGNNLAELPKGEQIFGGIKFQITNSFIQLGSKKVPDRPLTVEGIKVNQTFTELYIFHGTSHGFPVDGTTIGYYILYYEDNTSKRIPIVLGEDVRDWWNDDGSKAVTRGKVAWIGQNAARRKQNLMLRLYLTVWNNPHPNKKVTSIDYVSTNTEASPFCVAMTVGETGGGID
jgi:WD40 repeat protein